MPKQVWDPTTRSYTFVPEGIQVAGVSFTTRAPVVEKLRDRGLSIEARAATTASVLDEMIRDTFACTGWSEVQQEAIRRIKLRAPAKEPWIGKHGYMEFTGIPGMYQASLKNLIDNNDPAPGHDRGAHATNPMNIQGAITSKTEYDLTATQAGRATRVVKGGVWAFYYSTSHAHGTYNYYLIVYGDKPVLRGSIDEVNRVELQ